MRFIPLLLLVACAPAPVDVSALSLNIATGAGAAWNTESVRMRQREFLAAHPTDLVGLQEVGVSLPQTGPIDTAAVVLPADGTLVHGVAQYEEGGTYGNALWVSPRHEVLSVETFVHDDKGDEEPRCVLVVTVRLETGHVVRVGVTHLSVYGPRPAALRAEQLALIAGLDLDLLVGDFNAPPSDVAAALPSLEGPGNDSIDAAWWRRGWATGAVTLLATDGASDHTHAAMARLVVGGAP